MRPLKRSLLNRPSSSFSSLTMSASSPVVSPAAVSAETAQPSAAPAATRPPTLTSLLAALKQRTDNEAAWAATAPPIVASEPAPPRIALAASGGGGSSPAPIQKAWNTSAAPARAAPRSKQGYHHRPKFTEEQKHAYKAALHHEMNVEPWCINFFPDIQLIKELFANKYTFYSPDSEHLINSLLKKLEAVAAKGHADAVTDFPLPHHSAEELREYHAKCVNAVQTMLDTYNRQKMLHEEQQLAAQQAMQQQLFEQQQQQQAAQQAMQQQIIQQQQAAQQAMQQQLFEQQQAAQLLMQSLATMSGGGRAPSPELCHFHFYGGGCTKGSACTFSHDQQ